MDLFKRSRDEYGSEVIDHIKMANYLMFLSQGLNIGDHFTPSTVTTTTSHQYSTNRVFECKTCSRQFPSFQALGGHRASHKRPRLMTTIANSSLLSSGHGNSGASSSPPKPKSHECSICGLEFGIGQALGGHMRRHRAVNTANNTTDTVESDSLQNTLVMKTKTTSTSSNKVNVLCLDLNLTPLENDNLEFRLGKKMAIASMVG